MAGLALGALLAACAPAPSRGTPIAVRTVAVGEFRGFYGEEVRRGVIAGLEARGFVVSAAGADVRVTGRAVPFRDASGRIRNRVQDCRAWVEHARSGQTLRAYEESGIGLYAPSYPMVQGCADHIVREIAADFRPLR